MQGTQITAERIKLQAKEKGVSAKKVLEICELGPNTITKMANGSDIVSQSLRKIADYLDCSVDYLLGRVDTPNGIYSINNNNTTINGTQANVINNTPAEKPDDLTEQFFNKFAELSFEEKIDTMQYVNKTYRVKKTKIYEE